LQGKCNEIEQLGENVAVLIRIADPPFSKIGSSMDLGELIKQHGDALKTAAAELVDGKREEVVGALGAIVLGIVTKHPEMASGTKTGSSKNEASLVG
jgi:hypothetical protein